AWKMKDAGKSLRDLVSDSNVRMKTRIAALDGLTALGGSDNENAIRDVSESGRPMAVRYHAAAVLAGIDLDTGAASAARALAGASASDDPLPVVEAFLIRKGGPEKLAAALEKQKLSADAAKRVLHAMYLAGRNDAALATVVGRLAGLEASP